MPLDIIARRLVPDRIRQNIGCWALHTASRNTQILRWYTKLIHGYNLDGLTIKGDHAEYPYHGGVICSPTDGVGSFFEVFHERVYDSVLTPSPGDVVFDIGAYVGMWTVRSALQVGPRGMVYAFEPSEGNRSWLHRNTTAMDNVIVRPEAVSDHTGLEQFYLSPASACNSLIIKQKKSVYLRCITVDQAVRDWGINRLGFIKIDAEGAEMKVLAGAEQTLRSRDVALSIAAYHHLPDGKPEVEAIMGFLENLNYTIKTDSGLRRYIYAKKAG